MESLTKELKHLINKSIYIVVGIIVACLCGFWIHDCNKYQQPEVCRPSVRIVMNDSEQIYCSNGAIVSTQVLEPDPNLNHFRYKVLLTCSCPQPVAKP